MPGQPGLDLGDLPCVLDVHAARGLAIVAPCLAASSKVHRHDAPDLVEPVVEYLYVVVVHVDVVEPLALALFEQVPHGRVDELRRVGQAVLPGLLCSKGLADLVVQGAAHLCRDPVLRGCSRHV